MAWPFRVSLALILSNVLVCMVVFGTFLFGAGIFEPAAQQLLCATLITRTHFLAGGLAVVSLIGSASTKANRSHGARRYALAALPAAVICMLGFQSAIKSPHACIPQPGTYGLFFVAAALLLVLGLRAGSTQDRSG